MERRAYTGREVPAIFFLGGGGYFSLFFSFLAHKFQLSSFYSYRKCRMHQHWNRHTEYVLVAIVYVFGGSKSVRV